MLPVFQLERKISLLAGGRIALVSGGDRLGPCYTRLDSGREAALAPRWRRPGVLVLDRNQTMETMANRLFLAVTTETEGRLTLDNALGKPGPCMDANRFRCRD